MAKLYEMCNEIDSDEILKEREELTEEEKKKIMVYVEKETKGFGKKGKRAGIIAAWTAAAAVLAIVILPNTSENVAYAMARIPVLGNVIKAVTIREYSYEGERYEAKIDEVQLEQEVPGNAGGDLAADVSVNDVTEKTDESIAVINESIEEMTKRLIKQFEEQAETGESYGGVYVDHEIMTDTDKWFTLKIDVAEVAGSGVQYQYYYHIDKTTGEIASLKDIFQEGVDYVTPVSENIRKQMKEQMAEDDMKMYWVDEEEDVGFYFEKIKEDQNFYFNGQGQLVICFDEYEVAPGYMGLVEFVVEDEAVRDILK